MQGLVLYPRLALNLTSFCFSLSAAGFREAHQFLSLEDQKRDYKEYICELGVEDK